MATITTLEEGRNKYLKCVVYHYEAIPDTSDNRRGTGVLADNSGAIRFVSYKECDLIKVNTTLILQNTILKDRQIIFTGKTAVYATSDMDLTPNAREIARKKVEEPRFEFVNIEEIPKLDNDKKVSISGYIKSVEQEKMVDVKGEQMPVREISIADEEGNASVVCNVWREAAYVEVATGDAITIHDSNVRYSPYKKQKCLTINYKDQMKVSAPKPRNTDVLILGVSEKDQHVVSLVAEDDGSPIVLECRKELLLKSLSLDEWDTDLVTQCFPVNKQVEIERNRILSLN